MSLLEMFYDVDVFCLLTALPPEEEIAVDY